MAKSVEEEVRELKEKNNALVQKVQYWKMLAAQKEEEKIDLMKELNQMRLTISHYRSSSSALDSVLDSSIQEFGEQTLTRLVEVSSTITRTVEVMKTYLHKKREIEEASPNGKISVLDSPRDRSSNKVLRVVPMIRGRSIGKPIILLRPIDPAAHGLRQGEGDRDDNSQEQEVVSPPQHSLQDVYIPLRRIDAETFNSLNVRRGSQPADTLDDNDDISNASFDDPELNLEEEDLLTENVDRETDEAVQDDSQQDDIVNKREMETVLEETEDENWSPQVMLSRELPNARRRVDNPLEGPSWLLDRLDRAGLDQLYSDVSSPVVSKKTATQPKSEKKSTQGTSLEPDSTTDVSQANLTLRNVSPVATSSPHLLPQRRSPDSPAPAHTPTRRRRRHSRLSTPRLSLALLDEWAHTDGERALTNKENLAMSQDPTKVLVMVAKMRGDELWNGVRPHSTPPSMRSRVPLDAPSPNGSTQDAGPIVMDSPERIQSVAGQSDAIQDADRIDNRRETQTVNCRARNKSTESDNSTHRFNQQKTDERNVKKAPQKRSKKSARQESLTRERVSEDRSSRTDGGSDDMSSRAASSDDSESETGRERERPKRPRRAPPSYKEKPLNRKLRR